MDDNIREINLQEPQKETWKTKMQSSFDKLSKERQLIIVYAAIAIVIIIAVINAFKIVEFFS